LKQKDEGGSEFPLLPMPGFIRPKKKGREKKREIPPSALSKDDRKSKTKKRKNSRGLKKEKGEKKGRGKEKSGERIFLEYIPTPGEEGRGKRGVLFSDD